MCVRLWVNDMNELISAQRLHFRSKGQHPNTLYLWDQIDHVPVDFPTDSVKIPHRQICPAYALTSSHSSSLEWLCLGNMFLWAPSYTWAVSTTALLTRYTAMKYTAIQCTNICSALRRWLVLSQMEHYVNHLAEVTDASLLATLAKLNLPK